MDTGLLYVVYNEWIRDPKTGIMPYKIGITNKSVEDRYYGLGLKMPGDFICRFAYEFPINSLKEIENTLQDLFQKDRVNGEWFIIDEIQLFAITAVCEKKGGRIVTEKVENEIESQTKMKSMQFKNQIYNKKWTKDYTKYKFNNEDYGKGKLVLAVIKEFVRDHNKYSYSDLEKIFPKKIQGSIGVFGKYNDIFKQYKDINHKRHFLNENEIIQLHDGEKIVVSKEWGKENIKKFIDRAIELGYKIE
jgi:hypothetical protein